MSKQDEQEVKTEMSRRGFLKAGGVAMGTVALGLTAGCGDNVTRIVQPGTSTDTDTSDSWMTPPAAITNIASTVTADVIVVGSGISGLTTANAAAENGAKVILISASKAPVYRGGSFHVAYSKEMQRRGVDRYDVDIFFRQQLACASYNVDQDKWWTFYNKSEEAVNWLIDKMETAGYTTILECEAQEANNGPANVPATVHGWINETMTQAGMGASFVANTLADTAKASGVQVIYQMVAKQLVRGTNNTTGRVTAVIAQGADGKYTKYTGTKAIVLATGDFSGDKAMMTKYCPMGVELLTENTDFNYDIGVRFGGLFKGDGHKMGLWIGAAWQKAFPNAPMIQGNWVACTQPGSGHTGLVVNKNGYRFGNEDVISAYAGIQNFHQPGNVSYAIWDSAYATTGAPWYKMGMYAWDKPLSATDVVKGWEDNVASKAFVKGDSVDSVISQLGLPAATTKATVDRYNTMVSSGVDTDYHKKKAFLCPITTGPFYGGLIDKPNLLTVMGGLRTNKDMQVCDANDQPIPGLFNVGTMIGDYYGNVYNFQVAGNNYGASCLTLGYLTGRAIAKGTV